MNHLEYMRKIGKKGGAKRASHPLRIEMARKAAELRWARYRHAKRISSNDANPQSNEKITENKL